MKSSTNKMIPSHPPVALSTLPLSTHSPIPVLNDSFHFFSKIVLKITPVFGVLCSNRCAKICMYFFIQREYDRRRKAFSAEFRDKTTDGVGGCIRPYEGCAGGWVNGRGQGQPVGWVRF
jgi:hypothetical protein